MKIELKLVNLILMKKWSKIITCC